MSVDTNADKLLASAKQHIKLAILELRQIEDREANGWDDWTLVYLNKIGRSVRSLREIRDELRTSDDD